MKISEYLSHGQANAVPLKHLVSITGIDSRIVRKMIAEERLSGTPILSDNLSGYFLPETEEECVRFVRSMRSRAKEIMDVAGAVEKATRLDGMEAHTNADK